jgi:hypothetical protein
MDDLLVDVRERKPRWRESIRDRREILAPPGYISVYHETKEEFIPAIDREGLRVGTESNFAAPGAMRRQNMIMDEIRPKELRELGISRHGLYAYPYLEEGNGLGGAAKRHVRPDRQRLTWRYESFAEYKPSYLQKLGVTTVEEYITKMTEPDYLRSTYPGEIIELKVDPKTCYVGDMEYIARITDDMRMRGLPEDEAAREQAQEYWSTLVTLEDFLTWYRKPEYEADGETIRNSHLYRDGIPYSASEYLPIKGAPEHLPLSINTPEILIPGSVPQEHIRLVK